MVSSNDFKNGMTILYEGKIYKIMEFMHVKPGKGGAFVRTKLRDLRNGTIVDITFNAAEKVEKATIDKIEMQYLYDSGDSLVFMFLHKVCTDLAGDNRQERETKDGEDGKDSDCFMVQTPAQRTLVPAVNDIEQAHDGLIVPSLLICLVIYQISFFIHMHFLGFKQLGTEHRGQGDSHEGRSTADHRHDPS